MPAVLSLSEIDVRIAGIVLIAVAIVLMVAEAVAPTVGIFALGGAALMTVGVLLFVGELVSLDLTLLVPGAIVAGVVALLIARVAFRVRRLPPVTPGGDPIGFVATISDRGQIFFGGTWWQTNSGKPGDRVKVVGVDRLVFVVEQLD